MKNEKGTLMLLNHAAGGFAQNWPAPARTVNRSAVLHLRNGLMATALIAGFGCSGCHNQVSLNTPPPPPISMSSQIAVAPSDTPKSPASFRGTVKITEPRPGAQVSQYGENVRVKVSGALPDGDAVCVFVRDATGLDSNWWTWRAFRTSDSSIWQAPIQFGERVDSGRPIAITGLVLPESQIDSLPTVGALPGDPIARSEIVEISRN